MKERDSYLFRERKLDMEMPPDSLQAGGVNELLVAVTVDESFTAEQAAYVRTGQEVQTQILSSYRSYAQGTQVLCLASS
jgi:hypothetical protein